MLPLPLLMKTKLPGSSRGPEGHTRTWRRCWKEAQLVPIPIFPAAAPNELQMRAGVCRGAWCCGEEAEAADAAFISFALFMGRELARGCQQPALARALLQDHSRCRHSGRTRLVFHWLRPESGHSLPWLEPSLSEGVCGDGWPGTSSRAPPAQPSSQRFLLPRHSGASQCCLRAISKAVASHESRTRGMQSPAVLGGGTVAVK